MYMYAWVGERAFEVDVMCAQWFSTRVWFLRRKEKTGNSLSDKGSEIRAGPSYNFRSNSHSWLSSYQLIFCVIKR